MIRIRVVIALVVVSVLFLSIVYNKFEQSLFADKVENVELQMKNQISTMVAAFEADSKFLLKWAYTLNTEGTRRINWNSMAPYFAVAQLNAKFQVVEWSFRENSPISSLTKETLAQLVYSFQVSPENTQISFQFYLDPEKRRVLLTLVPVKEKLWVFASLGENLQSLMDGQKTLSSSLALVNRDLVSLAHVKPEYIGQKIFENPVIKDLKTNNKTSSSGSFSITSGEEFFAVMEKVPNSEMYLYSQASLSEIVKNKNDFRRQFIFFSFGFLFILVGVSFLLVPKNANSKPDVSMPKPVASAPVAQATSDAKPGVPHDLSKERIANNMKVASALGHEMKAPLVKILSLVQIGSFATSKEEAFKILNKVQWEARSAKEIIEKLLLFAGEKEQNKISTKIDTPLLRAIKNVEALCYQKVVKITKEIGSTEPFDMDVNQLVTVFENILKNSVQALDRKNNKEIKIKSFAKDGKVMVLIEDNGEGIPKDINEKVFDPFFTSMNVGQHMGLGLTVALGIVKQHCGNISIDSDRGQGARVLIEFDPVEAKSQNASATGVASAKPEGADSATTTVTGDPLPITPAAQDDDPDVFIIDETSPEEVNQVNSLASSKGKSETLNIPSIQKEVVLGNDDEKISLDLKSEKTAVPDSSSDNDLFEELNLTAKPISIRPVDLNVDVDKLFDDPSENLAEKKSTTTETSLPVAPSSFISAPKEMLAPPTQTRPSDDFKVTVRKPGRQA